MKQINSKIFIATIIAGGLFVGFIKGQDARNKWVSKMKSRHENPKEKTEKNGEEVALDDFEIASFHKS
jgi:hypothetical protein